MIKDKHQSWVGFLIEMIVLISLVLFIRFYIFQFFHVSGPSMCPTLNQVEDNCLRGNGEFIFVNEFLYHFIRDPKRGEVLVFRPETDNKPYIKRVIGVPGDKVTVKNGEVSVNGEMLNETYLSESNAGKTSTSQEEFEVPADHFLMFGDNRNQSLDARSCFSQIQKCNSGNSPYTHKKNIVGKAEFVIWPVWKARWIQNPFN